MNLFIIGDSQQHFKGIVPQLSQDNGHVVFYQDCIDAIAASVATPPDGYMISFDSMSPSGLAALRLLKYSEQLKKIDVIAFSEQSDPQLEERVLNAGAKMMLTVPMTPARILTAISQVFDL